MLSDQLIASNGTAMMYKLSGYFSTAEKTNCWLTIKMKNEIMNQNVGTKNKQ